MVFTAGYMIEVIQNKLSKLRTSWLGAIHEYTPLGDHGPDEICPICWLYATEDGWRTVPQHSRRSHNNRQASDKIRTYDDRPNRNACHVTNHRAYHDRTYSFPRAMVKAFRTRRSSDDTFHHGIYFQDRSRRKCFRSCQKANARSKRYEDKPEGSRRPLVGTTL